MFPPDLNEHTMNRRILILFLAGFVAIASCESTVSSEELCVARLKGRIVSNGPACAGVAIQILLGSFQPDHVDASWQNALQPNATVYQNVFKTYPYCAANEEQLKQFENILEEGNEFYFIFKNVEEGSCGFGNCAICEPLVSLPEKVNAIEIVTLVCSDFYIAE